MSEYTIPLRRLLSQRIEGTRPDRPEDAVRQLGAVQAQDYHQAVWAVGLRTRGASVHEVEQAIAERKLVLTWPMRGTIHLIPAEDVRWMLKLSAARMLAQDTRRLRQLELDADTIGRCSRLLRNALQGGGRIARPDLMQLMEEAGIRTAGQRGYHLLWHCAQSGLICMGPREGKQQTFVLLEEWVPDARELPKEEALARLAERYFVGHGPATVQDLAWWAGITLTDARQGLDAARSRLAVEKAGDREYWSAPQASAQAAADGPAVHLLPGFDEYLLGYKDRSLVLRPEYANKVVPGNNGVFMPTIVMDGRIAGLWKRTIGKKEIDIEFLPFEPVDDRMDRLAEAAERYCGFMGLPLGSTAVRLQAAGEGDAAAGGPVATE